MVWNFKCIIVPEFCPGIYENEIKTKIGIIFNSIIFCYALLIQWYPMIAKILGCHDDDVLHNMESYYFLWLNLLQRTQIYFFHSCVFAWEYSCYCTEIWIFINLITVQTRIICHVYVALHVFLLSIFASILI